MPHARAVDGLGLAFLIAAKLINHSEGASDPTLMQIHAIVLVSILRLRDHLRVGEIVAISAQHPMPLG